MMDAFIYPMNSTIQTSHPSFVIDVDASLLSTLESHLSRYVLRNKVKIRAATELKIVQAWGPNVSHMWENYVPDSMKSMPPGSVVARQGFVETGCRDPRHPLLGLRFVIPADQRRREFLFTQLAAL